MKNKILYFLILSIFIITSCDDDSKDELLESSSVSLDVDEVTLFDTPFNVNFTLSNAGVNTINIKGGVSIDKDLSISDKTTSVEFSSSDFGEAWDVGSTLDFQSTIDFDTHKSVIEHSIDVVDVTSVEVESSVIFQYDSLPNHISLKGKTTFNNLGNVIVEKKVITQAQPNPEFTLLVDEHANSSYLFKDSIYGVDFDITDTIVYKITATSGAFSESKMIEVPVQSNSFTGDALASLSISNDTVVFTPDSVAGVLSFNNINNPRGFQSSDVEFVKVEVGNQIENSNDLRNFSKIVKVVDESTLVNSVEDVVIGDTYAFKYMYKNNGYYGYLTITELTVKEIGDAENSIGFTYSQNIKYSK